MHGACAMNVLPCAVQGETKRPTYDVTRRQLRPERGSVSHPGRLVKMRGAALITTRSRRARRAIIRAQQAHTRTAL